jgi:putative lipoprotein
MHRVVFTAISALMITACGQDAASPEQQTVAAEEPPAAQQTMPEDDIRHFLLQEYPDAASIQYSVGWVNLGEGEEPEAVVHVISPEVCGSGGCNTLILTQAGPMWRKVGDISVSRTPITVTTGVTNDWYDITVDIGGGGGPSGTALLKFDGEAYPSNPTVEPAEMTEERGTVIIAEEPELKTVEAQPVSSE